MPPRPHRSARSPWYARRFAVAVTVAAALLATGCESDRPTAEDEPAGEIDEGAPLPPALVEFLDGIAEPGAVPATATYEVRVKLGGQPGPARATLASAPPTWRLDVDDLVVVGRAGSDGDGGGDDDTDADGGDDREDDDGGDDGDDDDEEEGTATCRPSTGRCVAGVREALLAPLGLTSRIVGDGAGAVLATNARRPGAADPVFTTRTEAGVELRCAAVPVAGRIPATTCLTPEGLVGYHDDPSRTITLVELTPGPPSPDATAIPYPIGPEL